MYVAVMGWVQEAVFDLLFQIMHVVKSSELQLRRNRIAGSAMLPNLLNNYIVMVVLACMDCGIIEILTKLGMSGDKQFSGVASLLLKELLSLSSDLLPKSMCSKLNVSTPTSALGGPRL